MVKMTRTVENHIKRSGLNQEIFSLIQQHLTVEAIPLEGFSQKILEYLRQETSQIQLGETLLMTSDVLESLFGKYKQFLSRSPQKQIGQTFLSI